MCIMSASVMLPNTPQTSTRSAGTAPAYDAVVPASAHSTSMPAGACARAVAASSGSSSTSRPRTSAAARVIRRARRGGRGPRPRTCSRPGSGRAARRRARPGCTAAPWRAGARAGCRAGRTPCATRASRAGVRHRTESSHDLSRRSVGNRVARQGSRSRASSRTPSSSSSAVGCTATTRSACDVGEICDIGPIGVKATNSLDEICALDADAVVYSPVMASTRDVIQLLESGKNVVTPVGWIYPGRHARRRRAAGRVPRRATSTLHGTGINPGGITERFPLMLSALCRDITPRARRGVLRHPQLPDRHGRARGHAVRQGPRDRGQEPDDRDPRARVHAVDRHGLRRARLDARPGEDLEARVGGRDASTWTRRSA